MPPKKCRSLGGSESARTEHSNQEVVSSRPCAARSVIHVESGVKGVLPLPFFPFALEGFPFPFRIYKSSLNEYEQICVDLGVSEFGRNCMNLDGYECG